MASPKPTMGLVSPTIQHPEPQRPLTLRRRISSGFSIVMSIVPLRKTTPQQEPVLRPTTAPTPKQLLAFQGIDAAQIIERQIPTPQVRLPSLIESQPCPYDQTKYHSFSKIERSRCTFCGMRSSRPSSSVPCKECRSKSPLSHIKLGFRRKPTFKGSKQVKSPSPEFPSRYSCSSDECPRIVPPEVAAKRIGNPPRRAALPVPRLAAIDNVLNPPPNRPPSHSAKRNSDPCSRCAFESEQVRAVSPKLHHLHGLPDSKAYPYVHKKEVQQHFAALRAGASSPLADFANAVHQKKEKNQGIDFSETVYYGRKPKPALVSDVQKRFPEQARSSNVFVEHMLVMGGRVSTERSRSEQRCSVSEQLYSSNVPARRSPVQQTQQPRVERTFNGGEDHGTTSTGERFYENSRSKVKNDSEDETILGLRGGDGDSYAYSPGCGLVLKQLLLTCRRPRRKCMADMSSDDDSPPRIPDPKQIAQTKSRANGTARLPKHIARGCGTQTTSKTTGTPLSNGDAEIRSPLHTASFTPIYTPPRPLICPLPLNCLYPSHATTQPPTQNFPINAAYLNPQSATPIIPCIRGGAGSPSTLNDDEKLPPTLFWLAGGNRREPIRTASWKAQKPKAENGGLLGWAVHRLQARKMLGRMEGESGKEGKKVAPGLRKEGAGEGGEKSGEASGSMEVKQDGGSSEEDHSGAVSKREVEKAERGAALDSAPEVAAGGGGTDPEQGDEK